MGSKLLPAVLWLLLGPAVLLPAHAHAEDVAPSTDEHTTLSVTRHSVRIGGVEHHYTATAGTMPILEEDGTKKADIFFMAYTLDTEEPDHSNRPLTFSFNGGPGSSSVWLHLGVFGPRRVVMESPEGAVALPPPHKVVPNEFSILDLTDLVFIDPVTTGYSRAAEGVDDKQFHGLREDVEAVGEFIRLYTTRFERWSSPKFLAGESYGTTRAAALADHLQTRHGMYLSGILLISSILDFQTARFDLGNDLPYILFLPTYTATAWYHGRLGEDLQRDLSAALHEAEAFARGEFASALLLGDTLPAERRDAVRASLARLTGLSETFIEHSDLRVPIMRFCKELMRDEARTAGRLDSRYLGIDRTPAGDGYEYDPSYAAIQGAYSGALNDYVRTELGYKSDLPYEILTGRVRPWNFAPFENRYVNVAEDLRRAMTRNAALRVFVASGYYDLATPYFATIHTFDHLGLAPSLRGNITMSFYEAGHMMYIHEPSLVKQRRDLDAFYKAALSPAAP